MDIKVPSAGRPREEVTGTESCSPDRHTPAGPEGNTAAGVTPAHRSGAWSTEELKGAVPLRLGTAPASQGAEALVNALHQRCLEAEAPSRGNRRGRSGAAKLRRAVGAIVGSVLVEGLRDHPRAVFISRSRSAFTGELVGEAAFRPAEDALVVLRLVERSKAVAFPFREGFGEAYQRHAARLRPTKALLAEAASHGITAETIVTAFRVDYPPTPITVKEADLIEVRPLQGYATKKANLKAGRLTSVEQRPVFDALRNDVAAMNAFASQHRFGGCRPPAWRRIFTDNAMLNGRWQSLGLSYQAMPKPERANIQIDGEPVNEIDIRASHLTILAALAGVSLPEGDPYGVPGIPRHIVKRWVVVTLGNGRCPKQWSQRTRAEEPEVEAWSIKDVTAAILCRLPFLAHPTSPRIAEAARIAGRAPDRQLPRLLALRLMRIEAQAMTLALRRLREEGILGLPVHDSLIVPRSAAPQARGMLEVACYETYGAKPVITSNGELEPP